MTSELNFESERAAEAHRIAFALMTTILSNHASELRPTLKLILDLPAKRSPDENRALAETFVDVVEVLTWIAAGNLAALHGDPEAALATVQQSAIDLEIWLRDERGETGD